LPYIFDTDTVSGLLRPKRDLGLLRRVALVPPGEIFLTSITLGELLFGAIRRPGRGLSERIERIASVTPVLSFDENAAKRFAEIKAHLEERGTPLAEPDLRIAGIALSYDLTLVTGNVRHFERVPNLRVENWLSPPAPSGGGPMSSPPTAGPR
jgi:tRNA(fMet)-specific endonuclease VapC